MAYEVKDWKEPNCVLNFKVSELSEREGFSQEINETYGEGGGLNATYTTVEAVAIIANILGREGLRYSKDFNFKTGSSDNISFNFADQETKDRAEKILRHLIV